MSYTNADGLYVLTHADQGLEQDKGTAILPVQRELVIDIPDFRTIKTTFAAVDIDPLDPVIPANAVILRAHLVMRTAATSGGSATLDVGTYLANGTAVSATGIDAAVALTAIDAIGEVVRCDGALITGTVTTGTAPTYIGLKWNTAAYTAGAGKLVIDYVV